MLFRKDTNMYKNELEIDVGRCLRALVKRIGFIILIGLLFFAAGFGFTLNVGPDKYSSSATVYAAADGSYQDAVSAVTAMNAYINVASSYKICQRAALIMGRADVTAEDVQAAVTVGTSSKAATATVSNFMNSSATIISFYATTTDPDLSMEMADAMAQSYALEMTEILNTDSVKVLDNAYTYNKAYDGVKKAWRNRILAFVAGIMIAAFVVVACEILDSRVRTIREATISETIPVIGIIPDYKN